MSWIVTSIILFVLFLIAGAIYLSSLRQDKNSRDEYELHPAIPGGIAFALALVWMIMTFLLSFHQIQYGHVGIVKTFGSLSTVLTEDGLTLIWPWQNFEQENVQTQSLLSPDDCYGGRFHNCFETFSKESIDVYVTGVLNFHIDPQNVRTLREQIGPDYIRKVILPRVHQVLKDETVKYAAVEITPNREKIRNAIRERLTRELAADGIAVTDFLLQNVDFKNEIKAAIDKKVIAEQEAEAAQKQVAVAKAQADQVAATAQGAADKLRIEAQGQADANRLVSQSLTPELIQFQAVQKLAPNIQIALLPSGQGIIIDPATLLGTKK